MDQITHASSGMTTVQLFRQLSPKGPSVPRSGSSLLFHLICSGGRWEGHLIGWKQGCVHVRILGFPPIEISQVIRFQYFIQNQESPLQHFQGIIKEIQVGTGSSPWKGSTDIFVKYPSGNEGLEYLTQVLPPGRLGRDLVGQVPDSEQSSRKTDQPHPGKLPAPIFPPIFRGKGTTIEELNRSTPKGGILSTRLTIKKDNGQRICAYHDRPAVGEPIALPAVIIAPGYGETKRDYLTLAYFFASNGFQVVRYDHTNHVGESDGLQYDATLSSMKADFQAVIRFVKNTWPHSTPIGVASSLAARAALKAQAEHPSLSLFIMLMGIINVQRSAATVHQEDIFANYCRGQYPDSANFLGFNVGSQFLRDALTNNFVTLEHTLNDAKRLLAPVIMVSAGRDAWVASDDLQAFRRTMHCRVKHWIEVPEALHRLQENPKRARDVYQQVVTHCLEQVTMSPSPGVIRHPNRSELGRQNREEKIALQGQAHTEVGSAFWEDYLGHFQSVGKCPDYVQLLEHVFHALGPLTPGQQILDAGCGNGNAGMFIANSLRPRSPGAIPLNSGPIRYVGIDVISDALRGANRALIAAMRERQHVHSMPHPMKLLWAQIDLNHPLPFPDSQFDRIVSNLVLGYVRDPRAVLKELYRVLAPAGRMVISNLKPDGDFSGIYQSLVNSAAIPQQREEARELLNNYGKIRQAEKEGQFCFFDRRQWEWAVAGLGCKNARISPTFAGQAFLIVLEKPAVYARASTPVIQNGYAQSPDVPSDALKQVA